MPASTDEYIEGLKHTLRTEAGLSPAVWRGLVEDGLARMYPDNIGGLAAMVQVIASELDSHGHFDEALSELDHIAHYVEEDPNSRVMVRAMRSGMLIAKGRSREALEIATEVASDLSAITSPGALAIATSSTLVVRLNVLEEAAGHGAESWLASRDGERGARLFVASWHIPYVFAMADRLQARPWIRSLKVQAKEERHPWRLADAAVFALADERAGAWTASLEGPLIGRHHLAALRAARLDLYSQVRREDWDAVDGCLAEIATHSDALGSEAIGAPEAFNAVVQALRDGEVRSMPTFPENVHLGNLPAVLAASEAVAYAGSQADAVRWLSAWQAHMPRGVRSSLEWPASADRLRGLLALRAGHPRLARRGLEAGARWSTTAKHRTELGLAQLQLAELYGSADFAIGEPRRQNMRRAGWATLRDCEVPPATHVYPVGRALTGQAGTGTRTRLTPREMQVISLFDEGLTYRAAGDRLGIARPTVQTIAHRIYEKLGVSGKMAACRAAREIGLM